MNAETLPPFRLAQLLRQLADARERNHPIAVDIAAAGPCPTSPPPSGFDHLRNGNLRCDFRPLPGLPPCTADGFVAVTNPARNNAPIFICCLEHLYHFHNPGQSYTASVSSNNPLARHYAFSLQAALRQLRQSPELRPLPGPTDPLPRRPNQTPSNPQPTNCPGTNVPTMRRPLK